MQSATASIRDALLPSLVMEGAMKPMMISGTQKLMNWLEMNLTVTMILSSALAIPDPSIALRASPAAIPTASATSSLNGRLCVKLYFFMLISLFLFLYFRTCISLIAGTNPFSNDAEPPVCRHESILKRR